MFDKIVMLVLIVFILGLTGLAIYSVPTLIQREKECQERGGIPHEELCLHPSAIIK